MNTRPKNLTLPLALALTCVLVVLWIAGTLGTEAGSAAEAQAARPLALPTRTVAPGATRMPAASISYSYDAAGRLTGVDYGSKQIRYSYDSAGNLLSRSVETVRRAYLPLAVKEHTP